MRNLRIGSFYPHCGLKHVHCVAHMRRRLREIEGGFDDGEPPVRGLHEWRYVLKC